MKVRVELSFVLLQEPQLFINIDSQTRKVYVWGDKIASFSDSYNSFRRCSEQSEDHPGFVEILEPVDEQPPASIDDSWEEIYKTIPGPIVSLEWFPVQNMIRLYWTQQSQSLQEGKVKPAVLEQLQMLNLDLPPLAKVMTT